MKYPLDRPTNDFAFYWDNPELSIYDNGPSGAAFLYEENLDPSRYNYKFRNSGSGYRSLMNFKHTIESAYPWLIVFFENGYHYAIPYKKP